MKVAGKWLTPQEVESCLKRHPAVDECAVVGVGSSGSTLNRRFAIIVNAYPCVACQTRTATSTIVEFNSTRASSIQDIGRLFCLCSILAYP